MALLYCNWPSFLINIAIHVLIYIKFPLYDWDDLFMLLVRQFVCLAGYWTVAWECGVVNSTIAEEVLAVKVVMINHKQLLLHFKNCKQIAFSYWDWLIPCLGTNWGRLTGHMMQTEVGLWPNVGCSKRERFLTKWTNWVLFIRYASETKEVLFFWQYSSRERSLHLGLTSNRPVIHKTVDDHLGCSVYAHKLGCRFLVQPWEDAIVKIHMHNIRFRCHCGLIEDACKKAGLPFPSHLRLDASSILTSTKFM